MSVPPDTRLGKWGSATLLDTCLGKRRSAALLDTGLGKRRSAAEAMRTHCCLVTSRV